MRALRTTSVAFLLAVTVVSLTVGDSYALAQSVGDAQQSADQAAKRAEAASGLVDEAVANREEIEQELASSISRVNDLSAQLTTVAVGVDKLQAQIGFADAELSGIQTAIEAQAIDAYMTAVAAPGVTLVNSTNVEKALVAGQVMGDVVSSGQAAVDELVAKKKVLEDLQVEYATQQKELADVKVEMDAETEHLTALYESADAAVAQAMRDASAADIAFRDALSAVDVAQAREAERERENSRPGTTTTTTQPSGGDSTVPPKTTTTTTPSTTPSTTEPPATTTTTTGSGAGNHAFPPAVEQWRGLVQQYFPSSRVDEALAVLQCESGGDPNAYNPYSGASGLFQFLPSTWASTAPSAGFPGASVFDAEPNIGSAAWLAGRYEQLGRSFWEAWSCRRVLG
ncbi:MAG: transglycosylase SLT domain-containing protein [Acidimicrobiia bacterium]